MGNTVDQGARRKRAARRARRKKSQQAEDEISDFTCEICIEPVVSSRKFRHGGGACSHPFCSDCIAKYIEVKVEDHTGSIKCPRQSCKQSLDPLACRAIISKPVFEKWCDLVLDSTVSQFERCYCPYIGCSALVLNESREKLTKVDCPNCKKKFCYQCKIPWHAGYRCSESRRWRDPNDILVGQLIEANKWTRCYNCRHSVERVSGCRHITCKCGVNFCHECGGRLHSGSCKSKNKDELARARTRTITCCGWFVAVLIMVLALAIILKLTLA